VTEVVRLWVRAPFATFRQYTATNYRPTFLVMPPSTAYGFVMNVACLDTRISQDLPSIQVAVGNVSSPTVAVHTQQVHRFKPSEKTTADGRKPGISIARREFLVDYNGVIAVRCGQDFAKRLRQGLNGELTADYGPLFLGDNDYLVDFLNEATVAARWYCTKPSSEDSSEACNLTISIQRKVTSVTSHMATFYPTDLTEDIPESAWTSPIGER